MLALPADGNLTELQRGFASAVLSGDAPIPATIRLASGPAHASRFGVYRNNVIAGLINAVGARYPVVRKLLWDESFNRVAHLYVLTEPPRSPVLVDYGKTFPQFLRRVGQGAPADYLADIAELESARTRAYHSADVSPLSHEALRAVPPEDWPELHVALHPSMTLMKSDFPIVSVWEANLQANDNTLEAWRPECALVARPDFDVEVRLIPPPVHAFLAALAESHSVGHAIEQAMRGVSGFDLEACFSALIAARIVVGLHR